MKLFRVRPKPENGEEEKELVLDTDAEEQPPAQDTTEAEAETPEATSPAGQTAVSESPNDPLAAMRAEAANEVAAAETPPEGASASPQPDDTLDPGLLELFREAKNEVQESTLASELPDIPIQELLSDLVSISLDLGITPRVRAQPRQAKALHRGPDREQGGK